MHLAATRSRALNSGTAKVIQRWSVLERHCVQRSLSRESGSGQKNGTDEGDEANKPGREEAEAQPDQPLKTIGRGRGAFSHFLRLHERNIDKHSAAGRRARRQRRSPDKAVPGQFDDASEEGGAETRSTRPRPRGRDQGMRSTEGGRGREDAKDSTTWVRNWYAQVEDEGDPDEPDWEDLDDEEPEDDEEDRAKEAEFGPDTWWCKDKEDFEEYKKFMARVEREEKEQLEALQAKWDDMKRKAAEEGSTEKLELPDIVITTELTYEAPPGKATVDRPRPLPRGLDKILASLELPDALDVKPEDSEYEEVVNMWKSLSRNNTMDERTKASIIKSIAGFIAKHRDSDALDRALGTKTEVEGSRGGGGRKGR